MKYQMFIESTEQLFSKEDNNGNLSERNGNDSLFFPKLVHTFQVCTFLDFWETVGLNVLFSILRNHR